MYIVMTIEKKHLHEYHEIKLNIMKYALNCVS